MTTTDQNRKNLEILLVEDNFGDVQLVAEACKIADLPFNLRAVEDGEEAMMYLRKEGEKYQNSSRPDLILLDLNMDRKDGRQTLKEIKSNILFRDIPVVIFSSSDSERDITDAYRNSANAYVVKQQSLKDFVKTLEAITEFWFNTAKHPL